MVQRIFDTNILIDYPEVIDENCIIIYPVLAELDKLHRKGSSVRTEAGRALRKIDEINAPLLYKEEYDLYFDCVDDAILCYAYNEGLPIVTNDRAMRLKAQTLEISTGHYTPENTEYSGYRHGKLNQNNKQTLLQGSIPFSKAKIDDVSPNEYIVYGSHIGRFCGEEIKYVKNYTACNIKAINQEQIMVMDALFDPAIKLVTLQGQAGTGKTLLSLACGIAQLKDYKRIIVTKPVVPVGKDIGFLPGTMEEKMALWTQSFKDNLDVIMDKQLLSEEILKKICIEAITYMRGRSLPKQYIIIDEAQNLTKSEIKTILTRVGDNSKIVLTGDISQIDSPYLSSKNNGLSYVIEKFKNEFIAAHILLTECERSELSAIAAKIL